MLFNLVYPEHCTQKDMNQIFYSSSCTKSLKSGGYFTPIAHLSLEAITASVRIWTEMYS